MESAQNFEIISLEHPDYQESMNAIDFITDFKTLELLFISDEFITIQAKALDRLTELYEHKGKYRKMINLWKSMTGFTGWIPFIISELKKNNNIERIIQHVLIRYNPDIDKESSYYYYNQKDIEKLKGRKPISRIVDVIIRPMMEYDYNSKKFENVYKHGDYGLMYKYELVVKVLVEVDGEFLHDYHFVHCWNGHTDAHLKFYNKNTFLGEK